MWVNRRDSTGCDNARFPAGSSCSRVEMTTTTTTMTTGTGTGDDGGGDDVSMNADNASKRQLGGALTTMHTRACDMPSP